jgi:hypothetical protein
MFLGAFVTHTQIELLMAIYGLFISWIYTRFLKVQDGIRGDRSETFSFASFFPEFIQYVCFLCWKDILWMYIELAKTVQDWNTYPHHFISPPINRFLGHR